MCIISLDLLPNFVNVESYTLYFTELNLNYQEYHFILGFLRTCLQSVEAQVWNLEHPNVSCGVLPTKRQIGRLKLIFFTQDC